MAQLATPNARVDIYRGFNAANPYDPPTRPAVATGVAGLLRPHVRNGRFGYNAIALHWTNVLVLSIGRDIRSAYNGQLNSFNAANADTIIVPDYPIPGRCTAFVVILVQRVDRGGVGDHQRCYLDRCLPAATCPDSTMVTVPDCPNALPATLHVTLSQVIDCACLVGSYPLTWDGSAWTYTGTACSGQALTMQLESTGASIDGWHLTIVCGGQSQDGFADAGSSTCDPLFLLFPNYSFTVCCFGKVGVAVTV
jgi:hypothetical protein